MKKPNPACSRERELNDGQYSKISFSYFDAVLVLHVLFEIFLTVETN